MVYIYLLIPKAWCSCSTRKPFKCHLLFLFHCSYKIIIIIFTVTVVFWTFEWEHFENWIKTCFVIFCFLKFAGTTFIFSLQRYVSKQTNKQKMYMEWVYNKSRIIPPSAPPMYHVCLTSRASTVNIYNIHFFIV